ncbi:sensor domain-containing protein [Mycobacterium mantenii]|uniref:Nuclease PIN n=2 Tax=Mycobacterium mantenii TaxID=560555 RepID=A0A1A2TCQ8_MYCNT|nr:sensor domain-containing protein [Mycobacterium mantenii]OBH41805.1 nuclease PIN [Mycobacterium mantenii]OBH53931.1 nuclease PIN [Mycobacterium mantenii]OBH74170.1 nuclease PIN [Mycobacterium mantenii]
MTNPQDPYWQNPLSYDPLGRLPPPDVEPPVTPPPSFAPPPAPAPYRPPVNTLATLSLIFAFLFAPVGVILGHLGLAQIRRTGELGRDRALVGVTLSYIFIALAIVALTGWATLAGSAGSHRTSPGSSTAAGPPPPTVPPETVATLLPGLDALRNITADANLDVGPTWNSPGRSADDGSIDRPECWGSIAAGSPDAYAPGALAGYHAGEFTDTRSMMKSMQVIQGVAAFRDPAAAQSQLATLLSGWHQCGGTTVTVTAPGGQPIPMSVSAPADAGNGITTLDLTPKGIQVRSARAIATKANVVIDLNVSASGTTDSAPPRAAAVSIANYILGKIPG